MIPYQGSLEFQSSGCIVEFCQNEIENHELKWETQIILQQTSDSQLPLAETFWK